MTIKTETKTITISLRRYAGNHNPNLEPDVFDALETDFATGRARADGDLAIMATDTEVNDLLAWWEAEVDKINNGIDGDALNGISDEDRADGAKWVLDTREE